ncbi:MreB/Mbl protein [Streptomyces sp. YIM 130001]|uniref:rod shape-determining protein n=1 Tax=Streptomyces sp. YIM 130001 TaxID=2259644 RepID=UPI000E646330|nr:rod shape-determining protein [Streptomyces sp. YIM 130001]RII09346.1 MreB/Mbl protein [Streptomyces sp. YIM 130001]
MNATTGSRERSWVARRLRPGIALDLGSSRTRAWATGRGVFLDVPTITFPGTGASRPVQRGTIVDPEGAARMLVRLLGRQTSRLGRPAIVLTAPVLSDAGHRASARAVLDVLRPRSVLIIESAHAVALGCAADLTRPLLVVDMGAQLTEIALLVDGVVVRAERIPLGTGDLDPGEGQGEPADSVAAVVVGMLRDDPHGNMLRALRRGPLLAGGGALRPDVSGLLSRELDVPVLPVESPHTAALRGAAVALRSARGHSARTGGPGA